jgi:hypothetical protein
MLNCFLWVLQKKVNPFLVNENKKTFNCTCQQPIYPIDSTKPWMNAFLPIIYTGSNIVVYSTFNFCLASLSHLTIWFFIINIFLSCCAVNNSLFRAPQICHTTSFTGLHSENSKKKLYKQRISSNTKTTFGLFKHYDEKSRCACDAKLLYWPESDLCEEA